MRFIFKKNDFWWIGIGFLLGAGLRIIPTLPGLVPDIEYWANWGNFARVHGLNHVYESGSNYLPVYQYVLWLHALLFPNDAIATNMMHWLRWFTLAVEIAGLYLVYRWTDRKYAFSALLFVSLLNLGFTYNSMIWGQVDGILASLSFAVFYFIAKRKWWLVGLFLALTLWFKLQAIVYLPLWALLLLIYLPRKGAAAALGQFVGTFALSTLFIFLPFLLTEGAMDLFFATFKSLTNYYPFASLNAFNFWYLFFDKEAVRMPDSTTWAGISYKTIGFVLFCLSSLAAMGPIIKNALQKLRNRSCAPISKEKIWLSAALVTLCFFFFNTQMHERYAHAAIIFLTAYAFQTRSFGPYLLFSYANFINHEHVLRTFSFPNYGIFFFHPVFIAALFLILILWLFVKLYQSPRPTIN